MMFNPFRKASDAPAGTVSVVIPLYNHERYIRQTLDSVFTQTRAPHEVIVVDDGSRDKSAAVVEELQGQYPNLIFWKHPNRGAHATINAGIHRASGDYVAVLNSDDLFHPERFAEMAGVLDRQADVDAVFSDLSFIDDDGRSIPNDWYQQAMKFHRKADDLALTLVNGNIFMTTSNLLIRRSVFEEIGHFSGLRYTHDLDFFLRLVLAGKGIHRVDRPLMSYRLHATNTISEGHLKVKAEWAAVTAFFLERLWSRPDVDWTRVARFIEVLDRHTLTPSVLACMAYFRQHPSDTMECSPFFADQAFRASLNGYFQ